MYTYSKTLTLRSKTMRSSASQANPDVVKPPSLNTLYDIVDYPLVIDQGRVVLEGEKDGKKYSFESGKIRDTGGTISLMCHRLHRVF